MTSILEILINHSGIWTIAVFGSIAAWLAVFLYHSQGLKSKYPLPPGPKGLPIIGNLRQMPAERSEMQLAKWSEEYKSDVICITVFGTHVIYLNSVKAAVDLFDKRGANYNDRPPFVLLDAIGFKNENNLATVRDGLQWRKLRKPYGNFLSASSSLAYRDIQLKHAREMVKEIEKSPAKWKAYLSRFATRVIFSLAFAIDLEDENDPYFKLAEDMGWVISNMGNLGLSVFDFVPWLEYLPNWIGQYIPSVKFVRDWAPTIEEFHQRPFDAVMGKVKSGIIEPSFLGRLVEARERRDVDEQEAHKSFTNAELMGFGGSLYSAGQDTTYSSEMIFVMAMVLNSKVQIEAQKEIDSVTGGRRLPTFDDWKALPIMERIVYETFRFHSPIPLFPHKTLKKDVYRDMNIPKVVMLNAWAMLHDPDVYKDPFTFNPNRFLPVSEGGANEPIPVGHFGFGRRICPGQHLAFASVWIVATTLLAKFKISPGKDERGKDVMPQLEFSTGITSHPTLFPCNFTPRNSL